MSLKKRNKARMHPLISPMNITLEVLANLRKEITGTQIGKEEKILSLSADDLIDYIENTKKSRNFWY